MKMNSMQSSNGPSKIERKLLIALPIFVCMLLLYDMIFFGGDVAFGREVKYRVDKCDNAELRIISQTYSQYFVLIFVSESCPSCSEMLSDMDSMALSRYTEGNSCLVIVTDSKSKLKINTSRDDVIVLVDSEGQLFQEFNIVRVPSYVAVMSTINKALIADSSLNLLEWIAANVEQQ